MDHANLIYLESATDILGFDRRTGALASFRAKAAADQEFIAEASQPAFILQYLADGRFRELTSAQAAATEVTVIAGAADVATLTASYRGVGGFDLDITVTIRASPADCLTHWSLTLRNTSGLLISHIQYPIVVAHYRLAGTPGAEALAWPFGPGVLIPAPQPQDLAPDCAHTWQMRPENGDALHYPGYTTAQFLCYYNDRAGLYLACQDAAGFIKQITPAHREPGLRLGISHVGDWPQHGERTLPYEVVLGSFVGDWHAAAELYRSWALTQPWTAAPLAQRDNVPDWLLDSPSHIILRIQGQLDIGPTRPNTEFLPYAKAIPLLDALAARLQAPLVPVIMSWERPGPWIYPDCFPPAGGESLAEFCALARQRGWHIGTFCNGTRWVIGHFWSGYDGEDDFVRKAGARSVCRTHAGELWREHWDATWRPSYAGCLGTAMTREIAADFVKTVAGYGLDWIQFLDQNVGCATFPCFAADHEHPPLPGRWMTEAMRLLVDAFHTQARQTGAESDGTRQLAFSVEGPVNEYFIPDFAICDVRVVPPGHRHHGWGQGFIPLYHYLYHEFILIQGGFGSAPEPYHLPIRNAYNWVIGEIPGAVMKGDGELLNLDTMNWAPWEPQVGSNDDAIAVLRNGLALRRGAGRDFLVFGRMQAPAQVEGIALQRWQWSSRDHAIPAVFHEAWQSPDGRHAVALANWTTRPQSVTICDSRLGARATAHIAAEQDTSQALIAADGVFAVTLPPLSCVLVETAA
jgi:hypothetical protein